MMTEKGAPSGAAEVSARLDYVLREDGRTRAEIARVAGVDPSRLSEWTRVTGPVPSIESLQALLRALPWVSGHWVLTGEGDPVLRGEGWTANTLAAIRELLDGEKSPTRPTGRDLRSMLDDPRQRGRP